MATFLIFPHKFLYFLPYDDQPATHKLKSDINTLATAAAFSLRQRSIEHVSDPTVVNLDNCTSIESSSIQLQTKKWVGGNKK